MRTREQILAKYREARETILDFSSEVLFPYLEFEDIKDDVKPEKVEELRGTWKPEPLDGEVILAEMRAYMEFAWDKALGHRGLSAGRSVQKMGAWVWLLEDDELSEFIDDDKNYAQYGVPILYRVSQRYNFPIPTDSAVERMRQGLPCRPGCEDGCGR